MTLSADVVMWLAGLVITVIAGLGLYIWKDLVKRTEANSKEIADNHKAINEKVEEQNAKLGTMVSREEFSQTVSHHARALENVGSVMRDMQHAIAQRIDLVLFEMNRSRSDGKP